MAAKSSELQIEDGIPLPPARRGKAASSKLAEMKVGQSVLIPGIRQENAAGRASAASRRTGFKFVTRKVEGGIRIWRVK